MRKFLISIGSLQYEGLFSDTCAAVLDAMSRYPEARRISAKPL